MLSIEEANRLLPPCIRTLNGRISQYDLKAPSCSLTFRAVPEFCHSEVIVQGGFITGMLDAAMAQCCFMLFKEKNLIALPTLEIKVSFISPGNPGIIVARAWPVFTGKSTAFLEAELHQEEGERLIAKASSTVKLVFGR